MHLQADEAAEAGPLIPIAAGRVSISIIPWEWTPIIFRHRRPSAAVRPGYSFAVSLWQVEPVLAKLWRPLGESAPALRSFFRRRGRIDHPLDRLARSLRPGCRRVSRPASPSAVARSGGEWLFGVSRSIRLLRPGIDLVAPTLRGTRSRPAAMV
jgi:hypothetical protein